MGSLGGTGLKSERDLPHMECRMAQSRGHGSGERINLQFTPYPNLRMNRWCKSISRSVPKIDLLVTVWEEKQIEVCTG